MTGKMTDLVVAGQLAARAAGRRIRAEIEPPPDLDELSAAQDDDAAHEQRAEAAAQEQYDAARGDEDFPDKQAKNFHAPPLTCATAPGNALRTFPR